MDYFPLDITVPGTMILDKLAQNIHGHESLVFSSVSILQAHLVSLSLLPALCGNVFAILAVSVGILQIEPFNLGKRLFGIMVNFLNKILLETKVRSSVFRFFKTAG